MSTAGSPPAVSAVPELPNQVTHMRRLARTFANYFSPRPAARKVARRPLARPRLEALEDRSLLDASTLGTISGVAFIDSNANGVHDANERGVPGAPLTLTGTTATGAPATASATTDGNGGYQFLNVAAGTYQITAGPVSFLDGINPGSTGAAAG